MENKILLFRKAMAVLLLFLMLVANFYAFRQIKHHGLAAYFYQRMLVAYEIGGRPGLQQELSRALRQDRLPQESVLAKEFAQQIGAIGDPQQFLSEKLAEKIAKVNFFQELRNWAIVLIGVLLILRVVLTKVLCKV
jgi:hypothetical protein